MRHAHSARDGLSNMSCCTNGPIAGERPMFKPFPVQSEAGSRTPVRFSIHGICGSTFRLCKASSQHDVVLQEVPADLPDLPDVSCKMDDCLHSGAAKFFIYSNLQKDRKDCVWSHAVKAMSTIRSPCLPAGSDLCRFAM